MRRAFLLRTYCNQQNGTCKGHVVVLQVYRVVDYQHFVKCIVRKMRKKETTEQQQEYM